MSKKIQSSLFSFNFGPARERAAPAPDNDTPQSPEPGSASDMSSQEVASSPPEKRAKSATARKYRPEWETEFVWLKKQKLKIDGHEVDRMFCSICRCSGMNNAFTSVDGCGDLQRSALTRHRDREDHKIAVKSKPLKSRMETVVKQNADRRKDSHAGMIRTVYMMAKNEMADDLFSSLIELQLQNDCKALLEAPLYKHHSSVSEMQEAIADVINEDLQREINASPLISVIVDETVNVTIDKKLIVFLRIIADAKPKNVFSGNITIPAGNAETVTAAIFAELERRNIDSRKVIGLGSDGASVMTGRHNGVGVRMRRVNPYLTQVHCAAHRVALASSDASKGVEQVAKYRRTVNSVYNYFASRYERLRELNRALNNLDFLSLKQPCSVRWLSLSRAVKSIQSNWPALVMELDEDARTNPTADGTVRQLKQYAFIALTHTLADVLPIMDRLNLVFQRENVNLSLVKPMVNATIASLDELQRGQMSGVNERNFDREFRESNRHFRGHLLTYASDTNVAAYGRVRVDFIAHLTASLRDRFPEEDLNLLSCLDKVLNVPNYPNESLNEYAIAEIAVLADYFGTPKVNDAGVAIAPLLDGNQLREQFATVKRSLVGHGIGNFDDACRVLIEDYGDIFPSFKSLANVALVLPMSSVPCERGFSTQSRIKTARRSPLTDDHVNTLMLISIHGPPLADFDIDRAVTTFNV
ncbi:uncharacterized protein C17orf113-like [Ptychodera flava]|uniref:uncharacterized protein C17orf113-like n=1 Tax=Ptychodera flava TaxID=63121 RepID=UPI003969C6EA